MHQRTLAALAAIVAAAPLVACAGTGAAGATSQSARGGAAASVPAGSACDRRLLTKDDLAGILRDPIATVKSLAGDGDPQTCTFETAGFTTVEVTLRPGLGNTTVDAWLSGRMPVAAEPLAGVGDRAAWCGELKEVIATKNNVLCDIGVVGSPGATASPSTVKQRLGVLCNKIFAAPG